MRISSLPHLNNCPGFTILERFVSRPGFASAGAGTAIGAAIARFHKGESRDAMMAAFEQECPEAFRPNFRKILADYCDDPRNGLGDVLVESLELTVAATLAPAAEDPKQEPIQLVGHTDQIRTRYGQLYVWDVKSGEPEGRDLLFYHAWQLAGYAVAATATLGREVHVGGIIRLRDYEKRPRSGKVQGPVFYEAQWTLDQCRVMLDTMRQDIAWLNQGFVHLHPGAHCAWCPGENPATCASELQRRLTV